MRYKQSIYKGMINKPVHQWLLSVLLRRWQYQATAATTTTTVSSNNYNKT